MLIYYCEALDLTKAFDKKEQTSHISIRFIRIRCTRVKLGLPCSRFHRDSFLDTSWMIPAYETFIKETFDNKSSTFWRSIFLCLWRTKREVPSNPWLITVVNITTECPKFTANLYCTCLSINLYVHSVCAMTKNVLVNWGEAGLDTSLRSCA